MARATSALSHGCQHTQILSCLRKKLSDEKNASWEEVIEILLKDNFNQEAAFLSDKNQQTNGRGLIADGKVITAACDMYPQTLLNNLGMSAPPLIWISNPLLRTSPPWQNSDGSQRVCVAGVGCRTPLNVGRVVATKVGEWVGKREFLGVSGGAQGCDEAFGMSVMHNGGKVVHLLPHGLNKCSHDIYGYSMTVCPPNEAFSTGRAMERNALIYAMSHMSVVCSARYRIGGSWQGALAALKLRRAVVFADWTSAGEVASQTKLAEGTYGLAQRALRNLGAHPLSLELESLKAPIDEKLDAALDWSFEQMAGAVNTGLFAS